VLVAIILSLQSELSWVAYVCASFLKNKIKNRKNGLLQLAISRFFMPLNERKKQQ